MSETKTQYFALYGGLFIPIVDNVVRDGAYIVDGETVDSVGMFSLWRVLDRAVVDEIRHQLPADGRYRLILPAQDCRQLLRIVSSTESDLEAYVILGA